MMTFLFNFWDVLPEPITFVRTKVWLYHPVSTFWKHSSSNVLDRYVHHSHDTPQRLWAYVWLSPGRVSFDLKLQRLVHGHRLPSAGQCNIIGNTTRDAPEVVLSLRDRKHIVGSLRSGCGVFLWRPKPWTWPYQGCWAIHAATLSWKKLLVRMKPCDRAK